MTLIQSDIFWQTIGRFYLKFGSTLTWAKEDDKQVKLHYWVQWQPWIQYCHHESAQFSALWPVFCNINLALLLWSANWTSAICVACDLVSRHLTHCPSSCLLDRWQKNVKWNTCFRKDPKELSKNKTPEEKKLLDSSRFKTYDGPTNQKGMNKPLKPIPVFKQVGT